MIQLFNINNNVVDTTEFSNLLHDKVVDKFEQKFSNYVGSKYACSINSATNAIFLSLLNKDVTVKLPSMIPPVVANAILTSGNTIEFIDDIDWVGHSYILHQFDDYKIIDSAQKLEKTQFQTECNPEDLMIFSFYPTKPLGGADGGMIVTDNEDVYKRVKTMRLHGINKDIWDRFTAKVPSWEYDVVEAGFKYNMPDVTAAIGLGQLEQAELFRKERQKAVEFYYSKLSELKMIDLPITKIPFEDHAWHLFPIVLNEKSTISRNEFIDKLSEAGIGTSVHYKPLHQMTYYKTKYNLKVDDFPNAEKTWQGNVSLPLFPFMEKEDLEYICDTIKYILIGKF